MADIRILKIPSEGAVTYQIPGQVPLRAEGIVSLAQAVVNNLLTTPGSDGLSPTRGAGLGDLTRKYRTNSAELREEITSRVDELAEEMMEEQRQLDLPPKETLESMSVADISRSTDNRSQLNIYIRVQSAAGQDAQIQL